MNMTNLHFHGLHVSPNAPQDDVLSIMAMPGESLQYKVEVPRNQPPGFYWYHPHPHGESNKQVLDGMSGAIVIEGIERYVPEVMKMRERILVLRDRAFDGNSPDANAFKERCRSAARSMWIVDRTTGARLYRQRRRAAADSYRRGRTAVLPNRERVARFVRRFAKSTESNWK